MIAMFITLAWWLVAFWTRLWITAFVIYFLFSGILVIIRSTRTIIGASRPVKPHSRRKRTIVSSKTIIPRKLPPSGTDHDLANHATSKTITLTHSIPRLFRSNSLDESSTPKTAAMEQNDIRSMISDPSNGMYPDMASVLGRLNFSAKASALPDLPSSPSDMRHDQIRSILNYYKFYLQEINGAFKDKVSQVNKLEEELDAKRRDQYRVFSEQRTVEEVEKEAAFAWAEAKEKDTKIMELTNIIANFYRSSSNASAIEKENALAWEEVKKKEARIQVLNNMLLRATEGNGGFLVDPNELAVHPMENDDAALAWNEVQKRETRIKELENQLAYIADPDKSVVHYESVISRTKKELALAQAQVEQHKNKANELAAKFSDAKNDSQAIQNANTARNYDDELAQAWQEIEKHKKKNEELKDRIGQVRYDNMRVYNDNKRMMENNEKVRGKNNELWTERKGLKEKMTWLSKKLLSLHPEMELEVTMKLDESGSQSQDNKGKDASLGGPAEEENGGAPAGTSSPKEPGSDNGSGQFVSFF